jgi:hypothetical protein
MSFSNDTPDYHGLFFSALVFRFLGFQIDKVALFAK